MQAHNRPLTIKNDHSTDTEKNLNDEQTYIFSDKKNVELIEICNCTPTLISTVNQLLESRSS